jgi:hypothetical protein
MKEDTKVTQKINTEEEKSCKYFVLSYFNFRHFNLKAVRNASDVKHILLQKTWKVVGEIELSPFWNEKYSKEEMAVTALLALPHHQPDQLSHFNDIEVETLYTSGTPVPYERYFSLDW